MGNSAAQALRAGEADVIDPRPTATIVEQLGNMAGVVSDVDTGPAWEHLAFSLNHPPLDQPAVRRAIAHGIDRGMITREVLQPVHPDLAPLDSVVYVSNQPQYRPTWADELAYDPQESLRLLTAAGCERGDDGIFSCDGQRLSFRYATLSGDLRRQEFFEIIQAQLRDVGVELRAAFADAPVLFGDRLPGGDYEIAEWSWIGRPDPFGGNDIWRCDGELNFTGYCNRDVDDLLERSDSVVDPDTRAELFHDADALIAADVPVIPLFQTPTLLARRQGLEGLEANATSAGSTWNTEDWEWSE